MSTIDELPADKTPESSGRMSVRFWRAQVAEGRRSSATALAVWLARGSMVLCLLCFSHSVTAQTFESGNLNLPIPDNDAAGITSVISAPGGSGIVTDVNALFDMHHTFIGDLVVQLTSPTGTSVFLLNRHRDGFDGEDLVGSYEFDDEALIGIPETPFVLAPPITPGVYLPVESLASFDGEVADGDWTLFVSDNAFDDTGTLNFWQLILQTQPTNGQVFGTAAQANVGHQTLQFGVLRNQIGTAVRSGPPVDNFTLMLPNSVPQSLEGIQLASFRSPALEDETIVRGQSCDSCGELSLSDKGWNGWVVGYGGGGRVQRQAGADGLNYGTGGTQVGLYRWVDNETLAGFFGGYGFQNINMAGGSGTDIHSSSFGGFVRTSDKDRYWLTAASMGYDDYRSVRVGGVGVNRGDYHGFQGSAYLEHGWMMTRGDIQYVPNVAVQYVGVRQSGFTEGGVGGLTVGGVQTNSLRAKVGVDMEKLVSSECGRSLFMQGRAHYMHEFLDRNTIVSARSGVGPAFRQSGLDFGRDYAVVGTGLKLQTRKGIELQVDYDLQANDRQALHMGSGSVSFAY